MAASLDASNDLASGFSKLTVSGDMDFPFLVHEPTVDFVRKSKVMFLMRGLPGSGKSSISRAIASTYGESAALCSADVFFTDSKTGEYTFDPSKLEAAHNSSQEAAKAACIAARSPVVVDNTNIKFFAMKAYVHIAAKYEYMVVIVEPNTPWKFDVKILAAKNSHQVSKDIISKQLGDYKKILPLYYAWCLNENESLTLIDKAFEIYAECFQHDVFTNKFQNAFRPKSNSLHCTSKFIGKAAMQAGTTADYTNNPLVTTCNGKCFRLQVIGFVFSGQSMSAHINLIADDEALGLWDNDLTEDQLSQTLTKVLSKSYKKYGVDIERGSVAHITIAVANSAQPVQAGFDLVSTLALVQLDKNATKFDSESCHFLYFNKSICYAKLKVPVVVNSIFTTVFF